MDRIYVCHPYSHGGRADAETIARNRAAVVEICRGIVAEGHVPVAPQVYLDQFMSEAEERDKAILVCLALLEPCDRLRIASPTVTPGMVLEITRARELGIRIEQACATRGRAI